MIISWREELATNVPSIDDQHKELFSKFNDLLKACNQGSGREKIGEMMTFLKNYTEVHFLDEETFQQEIGFPEFPEHSRQHKEFVDKLVNMQKEYESGGASLSLVIKTNTMLAEWLLNHISRTDKKIGEYYRKIRGVS